MVEAGMARWRPQQVGKELSVTSGQGLHIRDHTAEQERDCLEGVLALIQSYSNRPVSNHRGPENKGDRLSSLIRLL